MTNRCGHVMPDKEPDIAQWDECAPGCLLLHGHEGMHLIVNRRGQYFFWEYEKEYCDSRNCACVADSGLIECCDYYEAKGNELLAVLQNLPYPVEYRAEEQYTRERMKEQLEFGF